jgi:hypothetical protein
MENKDLKEEPLKLSPPDSIDYAYPKLRRLSKDNIEDVKLISEVRGRLKERFSEDIYRKITMQVDFEELKSTNYFFNICLQKMLPENQKLLSFNNVQFILEQDKNFFDRKMMFLPDLLFNSRIQKYTEGGHTLTEGNLFADFVCKLKGKKFDYSVDKPLLVSTLDFEVKNLKNKSLEDDFYLDFGETAQTRNIEKEELNLLEYYECKNGLFNLVLRGDRVLVNFFDNTNHSFVHDKKFDIFVFENPGWQHSSIDNLENHVKNLKEIFY